MKKPLIILTGPTAVGKTSLSLSLAKELEGEIVSADSMQVYRYMDIGTAKIRKEERQGIAHHLIDVLDPWEDFNVVRFQEMAREALGKIWERGHIPIVTGGTGFYIQALLYDIHFTENNEDSSLRKDLENYARENGAEALHSRLVEVDEKAASQIHFNNVKRVIRALEFYYQTGKKMSEHNEEERKRTTPYDFKYFVLNDEREHLYAGINRRVDLMMEEGLVEEVRKLKEMGCDSAMVSMQGLGYKEILSHLEGEYTLDEAVYKIKRDTRHFAKRQITWFKRERDVIWLHKPDYDYDEMKIREAVLSYYI